MTALGDVAKGFLLTFIFFYIVAMVGNVISGNAVLFLFMLVGLIIPSLWLVYEYVKDKRNNQSRQ